MTAFKINLALAVLLALSSSCDRANHPCHGPNRLVFREARAAFLESGFVLLEMEQDTSWLKSVSFWNCQPCSNLDFQGYKTQKDSGPITPDYRITCGIKYPEEGVYYNLPPALRIEIYSVKPL